jgi:hypothetical protein
MPELLALNDLSTAERACEAGLRDGDRHLPPSRRRLSASCSCTTRDGDLVGELSYRGGWLGTSICDGGTERGREGPLS